MNASEDALRALARVLAPLVAEELRRTAAPSTQEPKDGDGAVLDDVLASVGWERAS